MYFRYNADGIRTFKSHYDHNTLDMYHVNYVLDGIKIVSECYTHEITNATYTINYYYDANDSVIGFNYNGTDGLVWYCIAYEGKTWYHMY